MEGVSDEVLIFGAATVATAVMLYYAVIHFFSCHWPMAMHASARYRVQTSE